MKKIFFYLLFLIVSDNAIGQKDNTIITKTESTNSISVKREKIYYNQYYYKRIRKNGFCEGTHSLVVESKIKELNTAFENSNTKAKDLFFKQWHDESIKMIKDDKYDTQLKKLVDCVSVNLFTPDTICNPLMWESLIIDSALTKKVVKERVYACYLDANYFVTSPRIHIRIVNDKTFPYGEDENTMLSEILYFYPKLKFKDKKQLFLTEDYRQILFNFLRCPCKSDDKLFLATINKRAFLAENIEISITHGYGFFWHFVTFPSIGKITINQSFTEAKAEFRNTFNTGGYAIFKKKRGQWIRTEYKPNSWIE